MAGKLPAGKNSRGKNLAEKRPSGENTGGIRPSREKSAGKRLSTKDAVWECWGDSCPPPSLVFSHIKIMGIIIKTAYSQEK